MFYTTNAIYQYIVCKKIKNFEFASKHLWQIVYGDNSCQPKLLVIVSAVLTEELKMSAKQFETKAINRIKQLSALSGVPYIFIRFPVDARKLDTLLLYDGNSTSIIDTSSLTNIFIDAGLPINPFPKVTSKEINKQSSSAYHVWQRNILGAELKVSDIDLLKINISDNTVIEAYELKRSFKEISQWTPYPEDYNNFRLLSNFFNKCDIPFKILYHIKKKEGGRYVENIDRLSIFPVDNSNSQLIGKNTIVTKEEFFNRNSD